MCTDYCNILISLRICIFRLYTEGKAVWKPCRYTTALVFNHRKPHDIHVNFPVSDCLYYITDHSQSTLKLILLKKTKKTHHRTFTLNSGIPIIRTFKQVIN